MDERILTLTSFLLLFFFLLTVSFALLYLFSRDPAYMFSTVLSASGFYFAFIFLASYELGVWEKEERCRS